MKESRGKSALSGSGHSKSKKSGKKAHGIHVRRGKSGGYILKHDPIPDETGMTTQDEHVAPDMQSMIAHLQDHFSDQPDAQVAPPPDTAQGQGAPAPQM